MFFLVSFYIALAVFSFGMIYRGYSWFSNSLTTEDNQYSPSIRIGAAVKGTFQTLFSLRFFILVKVLVVDILLQVRTLQESPFRWLMHICIYYGFMVLLLMHALENFISEPLFTDYYSTLNPFLFLRDFAGILVIFGVCLAIYRRFVLKSPRLITSPMDRATILLLAAIILSGVLLQGVKFTSHTEYQEMVEDWSRLEDSGQEIALESFWVEYFSIVSPTIKGPISQEQLSQGRELHEMYCAECHSSPKSALTGYAVAKMVSPIAYKLDQMDIVTILWYFHFIACFLGLAYLPFSKMFHIIASPLSLLINAGMDKNGKSNPANLATKRMLELDACTHCGACSMRCSMGPVFFEIPNPNILPSEKITALKMLASNKKVNQLDLADLQEGLCLCTNCHRCTDICPVGINLQDLWDAAREDILKKEIPEVMLLSPLSNYRSFMHDELGSDDYFRPVQLAQQTVAAQFNPKIQNNTLNLEIRNKPFQDLLEISVQGKTFCDCYNCKTCTMACPLVHHFDHPQKELSLLPHQIMHAASLGLKDMILGSRMLWVCLGCYRCQEQCPQGVHVTDVFYQLKNLALQELRERK